MMSSNYASLADELQSIDDSYKGAFAAAGGQQADPDGFAQKLRMRERIDRRNQARREWGGPFYRGFDQEREDPNMGTMSLVSQGMLESIQPGKHVRQNFGPLNGLTNLFQPRNS